METIQIHVSVELNLSQDVKNFIASTVANFLTGTPGAPTAVSTSPAPTAKISAAPKSVAPASNAPTTSAAPKSVAPAPTTPTTPTTSAAPTIEQVRQALAAKVNGHREEIKAKLNSFGAPSVTKLDPAKYSEMLEFLLNLS